MAPKKSWQVSSRRMLGLIGLCAFIGFEISCYVNLPLSLKVILAFVICQIIYLYSGTNFAPMISAMVLPVLMGTESMIYPVTAICLTGLIIIFEKFLIHQDYKQNMAFRPLPKPQAEDWKQLLLRCVIVSILVLLFVPMAMKCVVAPPLLVAFTEFSKSSCPARKKPYLVIGMIIVCGGIGMICRYIFAICLGLPLTVAAMLATLLMVLLVKKVQLFLPPAGALTILPMLLPIEGLILYPLWLF